MNVIKMNKFIFFVVLKSLITKGNFAREYIHTISYLFFPNFHKCFYKASFEKEIMFLHSFDTGGTLFRLSSC